MRANRVPVAVCHVHHDAIQDVVDHVIQVAQAIVLLRVLLRRVEVDALYLHVQKIVLRDVH